MNILLSYYILSSTLLQDKAQVNLGMEFFFPPLMF